MKRHILDVEIDDVYNGLLLDDGKKFFTYVKDSHCQFGTLTLRLLQYPTQEKVDRVLTEKAIYYLVDEFNAVTFINYNFKYHELIGG